MNFLDHCKETENIFWNTRFKGYRDWKRRMIEDYASKLHFETFFGFRYTGYLSNTQICNLPIQGTAFHVLLYTYIELVSLLERQKLRSKVLLQIHDEILMDVYPPELETITEAITEIGTKRIIKENPWIIVPLKIKFSKSAIDGNWAEMK